MQHLCQYYYGVSYFLSSTVTSNCLCPTAISFLRNSKLHALALWKTNPWLLLSDNEDITFPRCKRVVNGILNVHDIETSVMTFRDV